MSTNSSLESLTPYSGITVTLPAATVKANLLTLLRAIDPHCPSTCRELNIQFDPLQDGASGALLIGDSQVKVTAAQRCGISILVGGSQHYGAGAESRQVYISNIWVVATAMDAMLVNCEIQN